MIAPSESHKKMERHDWELIPPRPEDVNYGPVPPFPQWPNMRCKRCGATGPAGFSPAGPGPMGYGIVELPCLGKKALESRPPALASGDLASVVSDLKAIDDYLVGQRDIDNLGLKRIIAVLESIERRSRGVYERSKR